MMKRVREESWLELYLEKEKEKNEYDVQSYRDSRENVLENTVTTHSIIFQFIIKPSLLFREIMPNFLLSSELSGELIESGILQMIRLFYLLLFQSDFCTIKVPRNLQNSLFHHNELLDSIFNNTYDNIDLEKEVLPVECSECQERFFYYKDITVFDMLYNLRDYSSDDGKQLISFCTLSQAFVCMKCDPIVHCLQCGITVRESKLLDSGKCIKCLHLVKPPIEQRHCELPHKNIYEDIDIHKYSGDLYQCCSCDQFACSICCLEITTTHKRVCLSCFERQCLMNSVFFDNKDFIETYFRLKCIDTELDTEDINNFTDHMMTNRIHQRRTNDPCEFLKIISETRVELH